MVSLIKHNHSFFVLVPGEKVACLNCNHTSTDKRDMRHANVDPFAVRT